MAIPRAKVFKDDEGYWNSSVYYPNKHGGVSHVIFKSLIFARALNHAFVNAY
jgi:hypothetical protein